MGLLRWAGIRAPRTGTRQLVNADDNVHANKGLNRFNKRPSNVAPPIYRLPPDLLLQICATLSPPLPRDNFSVFGHYRHLFAAEQALNRTTLLALCRVNNYIGSLAACILWRTIIPVRSYQWSSVSVGTVFTRQDRQEPAKATQLRRLFLFVKQAPTLYQFSRLGNCHNLTHLHLEIASQDSVTNERLVYAIGRLDSLRTVVYHFLSSSDATRSITDEVHGTELILAAVQRPQLKSLRLNNLCNPDAYWQAMQVRQLDVLSLVWLASSTDQAKLTKLLIRLGTLKELALVSCVFKRGFFRRLLRNENVNIEAMSVYPALYYADGADVSYLAEVTSLRSLQLAFFTPTISLSALPEGLTEIRLFFLSWDNNVRILGELYRLVWQQSLRALKNIRVQGCLEPSSTMSADDIASCLAVLDAAAWSVKAFARAGVLVRPVNIVDRLRNVILRAAEGESEQA